MMDAAATALRCVDALESARLKCAIGGAIALGVWCPPRATLDVDLNIFVDSAQAASALAPLLELGAMGDPELLVRRLQAGDMAMMHLDGVRLDIFLPSIPFYDLAAERVVRVMLLGRSVPVLSAETIAVFKLLFNRGKDLVDLQRLAAFMGSELDHRWIRSQIADMLGAEDERIVAWDSIVRDHIS